MYSGDNYFVSSLCCQLILCLYIHTFYLAVICSYFSEKHDIIDSTFYICTFSFSLVYILMAIVMLKRWCQKKIDYVSGFTYASQIFSVIISLSDRRQRFRTVEWLVGNTDTLNSWFVLGFLAKFLRLVLCHISGKSLFSLHSFSHNTKWAK